MPLPLSPRNKESPVESSQSDSAWQRLVAYLFPLFSALVVFAAVIVIGRNLWQSRILTEENTERNLHGIAHSLSQQTARTLQAIDLTLIAVADSLRYSGVDWQRADDPRVRRILLDKRARAPYLRTLDVGDADGRIVHLLNNRPTSPVIIADRPYFAIHKTDPDRGLYVGAPVTSRVSNDWIIPISRRLEKPDGSFAGVIAGAMEPSVLRDFYSQMDLAADSAVALFRNDGTLVVRYPDAPEAVGKSFADSGILGDDPHHRLFRKRSPIDGIHRVYIKEQVPDSPLTVVIGYGETAVFADWRKNMWAFAAIAPVLLITCCGLSLLLLLYTTRREATLRALQQSKDRFRDFAEAASDRFWETDDRHRFIWHSSKSSGSRFIGKTRWEIYDIDVGADEHWRAHKMDLDARRPFRDFRYTRHEPNGTIRHRTVSGLPFYDKHGRFEGYRGTYTDITAQVLAQEQAAVDRNRFLRAMENLAEGFALYDADDRLVVCNSRFHELNKNVTRTLTHGKTFEEFLRACLKNDMIIEARGHEEEWLAQRIADHRNPPNVFEVMRGGRWYQIREQSDKHGGILFFVLDIHDQKTTELQNKALNERVRLQFECMPVACLVLSPEFVVIDWNPAAQRIFGYSREEMIGRSPYERMIPESRHDYVKAIERRLRAGETNVSGVSESITKDGHTITCEWFSTPILDSEKRLIGTLSMAVDITEKRKAEEKLRQAQRMEAVGQLTGGIAHDFNNLLQVIFGNSEILVQGLKDQPHLMRWAEMTRTAAERGANLPQRLLAFSRQQVLAPTMIDLTSLVAEFVELLKLTLPENIEIVTNLGDEISPLMLDLGQLENALLNPALNARDAMPSGGRLTIEAGNRVLKPGERQVDAAPGNYVTLAVTDTGTGMAPDVMKRAFEPFFTTKEVSKGSGLGLSMVYGFVAQSGGQVKLESRNGIGTTVTLWFPRGEVERFEYRESRQSAESMPTGSETILVVEDDAMVRSYVTDQLQSLGYSVTEADSGTAALTHLETLGPVDLLFTDIVMPGGMSGRELADEVARRYPTTKILFTSGYIQKAEDDRHPVPTGVNLLAKPYYRQDLAIRVREILDAR